MNSKSIKIRRSLRYKILFVVIPLFLISFGFLGLTTYFSSNNGITNIAKEFIGYRLKEIFEFSQNYIAEQKFLSDVNVDIESSRNESYNKIVQYAEKMESETFVLVPYSGEFTPVSDISWTTKTNFNADDLKKIFYILQEKEATAQENPEERSSWIKFETSEGSRYVGIFIPNADLQAWFVLLAHQDYFYAPVKEILHYLIIIVCISLVIMVVLILFFVNFITNPLTESVLTIKSITDSMDFSKRIKIRYPDEIGFLGQYFNKMIEELEKSYNQIKNYAYQTVVAKHREERIRFIFQKYVPSNVIDHVLNKSSNTMLVGNKQKVTVLFSDIRDFTTISEMLRPEELVLSLNVYFTAMVEQIIIHNGMVDKFIGDAIMAIFGAPLVKSGDADRAVESAVKMIEALKNFNTSQKEKKKITFDIGIGINTGDAIVGNIGSEQKVDYTVIGDPVNLGARLEGLTKSYRVPILISEFTKQEIMKKDRYFFLNVDTVRVKGKAFPVKIYYPLLMSQLSKQEHEFFTKFHAAQHSYYQAEFKSAHKQFKALEKYSLYNYLLDLYIDRCEYLIVNPPENWDGVETWKTK